MGFGYQTESVHLKPLITKPMATYKTPDVYIKEISIFPPSVAEVETAVPCFIGYTEMAQELTPGDLFMSGKKIRSIAEYQQYFGGPPPTENVMVTLDANNSPAAVSMNNTYYLYDSLRLFFNNGGGKCYIISIGDYNTSPSIGSTSPKVGIKGGLAVLKKLDEPTMILCPDATLTGSDLYTFAQDALRQCGDLMDRVAILDTANSGDLDDDVDDFRSGIGINNLKYGAAYIPWLKARFPKNARLREISLQRASGTPVALESLTNDPDIQAQIVLLRDTVIAEAQNYNAGVVVANLSGADSHSDRHQELVDDYNNNISSSSTIAQVRTNLRPIYQHIEALANSIDAFRDSIADDGDWKLRSDADNFITNSGIESDLLTLIYHASAMETSGNSLLSDPAALATNFGITTVPADQTTVDGQYSALPGNFEMGRLALQTAQGIFIGVLGAMNDILAAATAYEKEMENALKESFGSYKSILQKIDETLSIIPPSGAMAGVYSFVDSKRGVHKAPANVSINGVQGLTQNIDFELQQDLNVDVNAGKSINAIREFAGKGILVWGARTLAGNDNEWRYVPVRRFFNMVEESVKKSTYWAVFEPNDANLWVRVKAMIENYLIDKWKDGALAGATPEDAFFVKCGLGLTMTPQDILEGRLNVEIGMAVVRPAEFIILKFSHKMQES